MPNAENAAARMGTSMVCATDGHLKLFRPQGTGARAAGLPEELLVDLSDDPVEVRPAAPTPAQEQQHGATLRKFRAALDAAAASERPKTPVASTNPEADEALAEQLRHLGYL
jgi:hypothetical protein